MMKLDWKKVTNAFSNNEFSGQSFLEIIKNDKITFHEQFHENPLNKCPFHNIIFILSLFQQSFLCVIHKELHNRMNNISNNNNEWMKIKKKKFSEKYQS